MIEWLKSQKLAIAWISLIGSLAGVAFSAVDLKDTLAARKKRAKLNG